MTSTTLSISMSSPTLAPKSRSLRQRMLERAAKSSNNTIEEEDTLSMTVSSQGGTACASCCLSPHLAKETLALVHSIKANNKAKLPSSPTILASSPHSVMNRSSFDMDVAYLSAALGVDAAFLIGPQGVKLQQMKRRHHQGEARVSRGNNSNNHNKRPPLPKSAPKMSRPRPPTVITTTAATHKTTLTTTTRPGGGIALPPRRGSVAASQSSTSSSSCSDRTGLVSELTMDARILAPSPPQPAKQETKNHPQHKPVFWETVWQRVQRTTPEFDDEDDDCSTDDSVTSQDQASVVQQSDILTKIHAQLQAEKQRRHELMERVRQRRQEVLQVYEANLGSM